MNDDSYHNWLYSRAIRRFSWIIVKLNNLNWDIHIPDFLSRYNAQYILVTFCTEKEFALYGYETGPQNNTKGNLIRWLTHE